MAGFAFYLSIIAMTKKKISMNPFMLATTGNLDSGLQQRLDSFLEINENKSADGYVELSSNLKDLAKALKRGNFEAPIFSDKNCDVFFLLLLRKLGSNCRLDHLDPQSKYDMKKINFYNRIVAGASYWLLQKESLVDKITIQENKLLDSQGHFSAFGQQIFEPIFKGDLQLKQAILIELYHLGPIHCSAFLIDVDKAIFKSDLGLNNPTLHLSPVLLNWFAAISAKRAVPDGIFYSNVVPMVFYPIKNKSQFEKQAIYPLQLNHSYMELRDSLDIAMHSLYYKKELTASQFGSFFKKKSEKIKDKVLETMGNTIFGCCGV